HLRDPQSSFIEQPLASQLFCILLSFLFFFFFNDTATTEIYTLSLHDALPISPTTQPPPWKNTTMPPLVSARSEEHTPELQSHSDLVCRLLLEKKNSPRPRQKAPTNRKPRRVTPTISLIR